MRNIVVYIKVTSVATLLGLSAWYLLIDHSADYTPSVSTPETTIIESVATTALPTTPVFDKEESIITEDKTETLTPTVTIPKPTRVPIPTSTQITVPVVVSKPSAARSFNEDFSDTYTLHEAERISASAHPHWWVSSGGYLFSKGGVGSTIVGPLQSTDERYQAYRATNPTDTDGGLYPQNIFRLVQTERWHDSVQEAQFKIVGTNYSSSFNRNASNGLLFFVHYQDEFNLYYAGIRVDGYAVIKKKVEGTYYTLALEPVFVDRDIYKRSAKQNFLPQHEWFTLRSTVTTDETGAVNIRLYLDTSANGEWREILSATDTGKQFGGPVFTSGYAGIRTDFMDVNFAYYQITELQ